MQRMSFIESLMSFNERVLYNGNINLKKFYTMNELKKKLFFNKIFIENMQEIFQKHQCDSIIDKYIDSLNQYAQNISMILDKIEVEYNFEIPLSDMDIENNLVMNSYPSVEEVNYRFFNNIIYYLTLLDDGQLIISYMKSDQSVNYMIAYLNELYQADNTIAIRATINNSFKVIKVEFNGDIDHMKNIMSIFPSTALIVSNPFIYTDDIKEIIESMIEPDPVKVQQNFENIEFEDIFENDILIEYPTTSFDVYLQLLSSASTNKSVSSIYVSLYRIGKDPAIYYILREAVNNGIDVYVNIELCASGESINQMWAEKMSNVGIKVTTYASGKLKVHSKLTLFQFKNGKAISQIGTGNYHTQTTSQYTDLSLMTSNRDICNQVLDIFNIFAGKKNKASFNKNLLVTKYNARDELIKLIRRETKLGGDGYIAMKCNALDDEEINKYLDEAAKNNCQIDLIVRGVCTWIPDQLGYNVRIKSIIWDKLEHSRVYCFGSFNPTIYLGSLDLVTNKLDKRIETLVRVLDPYILGDLCDYLNHYITNASNSWILLRSGEYRKEEIEDEL